MINADELVEIIALYARYNRAIDAGDAEDWAACFVRDGIFYHPARSWSDVSELRQFVEERSAKFATNAIIDQRHWNDRFEISAEGDKARASCDLIVVGVSRDDGSAQVVAKGSYSDRLARTPAGWRFLERKLTVS